MNKIAEAILEADETTKTDGVVVKGGKKYLQVKDRVSIFRKTFGLDYGIDTTIVVDDGSSDCTSDLVEAEFPEVTLLKNDQNIALGTEII